MTRSERDEGGARGDARLTAGKGDRDEQRLLQVLQAAAARPDEVPAPSPFLGPRLRARITDAQKAGVAQQRLTTVGTLAWRVVPALVLGLTLLGVWTGLERAWADQAMDESVSSLVETTDIVGEVFGEEHPESREEEQ
jgi:hypothetical protein